MFCSNEALTVQISKDQSGCEEECACFPVRDVNP